MARATYVKKAQKDIIQAGVTIVHKGEPYYWWKFRFGGKHISKDRPKRSQLTQSGFLSELYSIEDDIEANLPSDDSLQSVVDDMISSLQSLLDQCQDSLNNMPENLQENSSSGQLLQERIDGLESWISDLENVNFEPDIDEEIKPDTEEYEDALVDFYQTLIEEIQGYNPGLS